MATIAFIHGLNTFGDDDIHVGPLRFGPMHSNLEMGLRARGLDFLPVLGIGAGSIDEQASRALEKIPQKPVHLLGQSTGGLVARALKELLGESALSTITLGTPHLGATAAEFGLTLPDRHPLMSGFFNAFGYDLRKRSSIYASFTREALKTFNERHPPSGTREFALLCSLDRRQVSWPLQILYRHLHDGGSSSDGFISLDSQRFGECRGPFALDHYGELGFFPYLTPHLRQAAQLEFARLLDEIHGIVTTLDRAQST